MIAEGRVSLKGLKADATVFDEMIMDVNTDYFEQHGGYEYACRFYEAAFHFAENLYGNPRVVWMSSYPSRQTDDDEQGGLTFEIKKGRLSFRLTAPYSADRRKASSDYAKENGMKGSAVHQEKH